MALKSGQDDLRHRAEGQEAQLAGALKESRMDLDEVRRKLGETEEDSRKLRRRMDDAVGGERWAREEADTCRARTEECQKDCEERVASIREGIGGVIKAATRDLEGQMALAKKRVAGAEKAEVDSLVARRAAELEAPKIRLAMEDRLAEQRESLTRELDLAHDAGVEKLKGEIVLAKERRGGQDYLIEQLRGEITDMTMTHEKEMQECADQIKELLQEGKRVRQNANEERGRASSLEAALKRVSAVPTNAMAFGPTPQSQIPYLLKIMLITK